MDEVARLLLSLGLGAVALTLAGGGFIWSMNESRRIRRSLSRVLGEPPHALLVAHGRGKGVGFNFATNQLAVCWDAGAWCLIYRVEELIGAELAVDGQVLARAHRGEPRRALDQMTGAETRVSLRLIFDDVRHPDFVLDLWLPEDDTRKDAMTAPQAMQEANRWIARVEAVLRRSAGRREASLAAMAAPTVAPPPAPMFETPAANSAGPPPWDEDEDEDEADEAIS